MTRKNTFLRGGLSSSTMIWDWQLDMTMKFYTNLAIGLKEKVGKFWGLILTFVEVTGEKLVGGGAILPPLPHPE